MRQPRIALAAALALICAPTARGLPQAELVLHFIEIGQGDGTPGCLQVGLRNSSTSAGLSSRSSATIRRRPGSKPYRGKSLAV